MVQVSDTGPSLFDLRTVLSGKILSIVHVAAGLSEAPSLGVHFGLRSVTTRSASQGPENLDDDERSILTSKSLDEFFRSLSETELKPLVILDPPRPPARFEMVRQLVLRNALATELFRLGNAPVVLATGLGDIVALEVIGTAIATIAAGQPIGLVTNLIRQSVTNEEHPPLDDLLYPVGTVLFAADPDSRAPGAGAEILPEVFTSKPQERITPMSRRVLALLVGIDTYPSPIPTLRNCVNDINAFESYLSERVSRDKGVELQLRTLKNGEATRQAVIDAFRDHLGQAGPTDIVLFYFSGHGSQEQSPEEFWKLEPDHLDETLVCHDSREPGCWDLADKELAKLIGEASGKGAHVSVILDCCHSGSGTRNLGTVVRRAPTDTRPRPIGSFLVTPSEAAAGRRDAGTASGWYAVPNGRHVLMAACRDHEEAKEYVGDSQYRGAFSYFLGDALKSAAGVPTYRDLFNRTSALVASHVESQSPQLEATRSDDLDAVFLDGVIQPTPSTYTASYRNGRWIINGGTILGIPADIGGDPIRLALFPFDATAANLGDLAKAVTTARVEEVFPATCHIAIEGG